MLDHGHPQARKYPIGLLLDESNIVIERLNGAIVTEANLMRMAVNGVLSKGSRQAFDKTIRKLSIETRPYDVEPEQPDTENGLPRLLPKGYGG